MAVQYLTYWGGLNVPRWEREADLEQYGRQMILKYWLGEPVQVKGDNAQYRNYRIHLSRRTTAHERGGGYVAPGYKMSGRRKDGPDVYNSDIVDSFLCVFQNGLCRLAVVQGGGAGGEPRSAGALSVLWIWIENTLSTSSEPPSMRAVVDRGTGAGISTCW